MLDARRMEVYSALYDADLNEIRPAMAEIIDEKSYTCLVQGDSRLRGKQRSAVANDNPMFFFGDGSTKCKGVISLPNAIFLDGIEPSATAMAKLSEEAYRAGNFVDVAYFEPFYLKDFMATVPRNKVLSAK
jgi:tRNA threonylcarbamoyladenosine biosynthesis protein TsaB